MFLIALTPLMITAKTLEGAAKNHKGELLYIERHTIEKDENGLSKFIKVEYLKPNGSKFAIMTSDFSKNKTVPETLFEDLRFKSKSAIRLTNNSVIFEEVKNEKETFNKMFKLNDSMVASQGFDNFIKLNSTTLEKKPIEFKFGVIDTKDFYTLTGYKNSSKSEHEIEYRIHPSNWLARIFAGELKIVYDSKNMTIKTYAGRSNILDDQGNSQDVIIHYQWSDGT